VRAALAPRCHFVAVTTVPLPTSEAMSNSSMSRLTPGRPMPRRLGREAVSRGRSWTARELSAAMVLPELTPAIAQSDGSSGEQ